MQVTLAIRVRREGEGADRQGVRCYCHHVDESWALLFEVIGTVKDEPMKMDVTFCCTEGEEGTGRGEADGETEGGRG